MTVKRLPLAFLAAGAFLCYAGALDTRCLSARTYVEQTVPDNSAQNKNQPKTAEDQTSSKTDRDITAKIRKSIMADKGLSTDAHNVKIITKNGAVTLKGPVKSADEKQKVMSCASNVVPPDTITDEMTVKQ
ncbi:MAG TPA: BON domain-containing protein [Edaphobacter sp.]|nr:BON domain-containing protein [Edaphobacter sp.]